MNTAIEGRIAEAKNVARRFVRSVARIYVVISVEKTPQSSHKKRYFNSKLAYLFSSQHKIFKHYI